jgi:hypothetical protein
MVTRFTGKVCGWTNRVGMFPPTLALLNPERGAEMIRAEMIRGERF